MVYLHGHRIVHLKCEKTGMAVVTSPAEAENGLTVETIPPNASNPKPRFKDWSDKNWN
jgi:hypothetical protein